MTELGTEKKMHPIWGQAFRPLFLGGAVFSIIAMGIWGLVLNGWLSFRPYANVMFWHQHEMLFGFVVAIVVGFLLTAVQNWTGLRATHGKPLLVLVLVWLAGRLVMAFGTTWPPILVILIESSFLPLTTIFLAHLLIQASNMRNLIFVPILLLLTGCNLLMHAGVYVGQAGLIHHGSIAAVFLITMLMILISGRILPMFTANGTQTPRVTESVWLERLTIGLVILLAFIHLLYLQGRLPPEIVSILFAAAAVCSGWRLLRLRGWITCRVPLLWSLHLAVLFIPVGFALFALRYAGLNVPHSAAIHALTAGAMGLMVLSMIARVSLGHTGRMLKVNPLMSMSFFLLWLAVLARIFAGWALPGTMMLWLNIAVVGWTVAYLGFVVIYWRVLMTPRVDNRPG